MSNIATTKVVKTKYLSLQRICSQESEPTRDSGVILSSLSLADTFLRGDYRTAYFHHVKDQLTLTQTEPREIQTTHRETTDSRCSPCTQPFHHGIHSHWDNLLGTLETPPLAKDLGRKKKVKETCPKSVWYDAKLNLTVPPVLTSAPVRDLQDFSAKAFPKLARAFALSL